MWWSMYLKPQKMTATSYLLHCILYSSGIFCSDNIWSSNNYTRISCVYYWPLLDFIWTLSAKILVSCWFSGTQLVLHNDYWTRHNTALWTVLQTCNGHVTFHTYKFGWLWLQFMKDSDNKSVRFGQKIRILEQTSQESLFCVFSCFVQWSRHYLVRKRNFSKNRPNESFSFANDAVSSMASYSPVSWSSIRQPISFMFVL